MGRGGGQGVLPRLVGDNDSTQERVGGARPVATRELWLPIHHELASWPRIRAVVDWIDDCIAVSREILAGT
ncbi:hypothetical protein [Varunaivibrio sulfuroxidans]|uniref:LysR substrate binding domain-containing protein n=1 Tax=Varunaivibrio sulfuroxidans TaxID=1773489 RepID=A0A4R3JGV5_9PROT|nr:hypothetical protein [Varunaivibrio sulfuroxidans]TCS65167.1 hypothetical protein EDD55_101501 [Varunaivibrio sulfuroxidans]WES29551.1 hypothetical protein P3M64_07755 [Varunaivibrio sulfuroxidans]